MIKILASGSAACSTDRKTEATFVPLTQQLITPTVRPSAAMVSSEEKKNVMSASTSRSSPLMMFLGASTAQSCKGSNVLPLAMMVDPHAMQYVETIASSEMKLAMSVLSNNLGALIAKSSPDTCAQRMEVNANPSVEMAR